MKFKMFCSGDSPTAEVETGIKPDDAPDEVQEAEFQKFKTQIHRELLDSLDLSNLADLDESELKIQIRRLAEGILRNRPSQTIDVNEDRLFEELIAESFGLGPIEAYMQDPNVADILV